MDNKQDVDNLKCNEVKDINPQTLQDCIEALSQDIRGNFVTEINLLHMAIRF